MRITKDGNVGIGTTSPSAPLSLLDASLTTVNTGEGGLRVHRPNSASQYGYFDYGYNGGGVNIGSLYTGGGASSFGTFLFRQHSSTTSQIPMFINNTGNVGIGTTSPTNAKLEVVSTSGEVFRADSASGAYRIVANQTGVSMQGAISVAGTGAFSGKLAVMSSSPHGTYDFYNNGTSYFNGSVIVDDHLSITGTNAQLTLSRTSTDQTAGFNITNNQNGGYGSGIVWNSKRSDAGVLTAAEITVSGENAWNSDSTSSSMMQFATRKDNTLTTHMTIRKAGNVGIGVTSPHSTLQVDGPDSAVTAHFGQGQSNGSGIFGGISLGYAENANSNYRKVAIVAKALSDGAARQDLHFLVDTVNDQNSAGLADSKMMIDGLTGNVGIGNTSPSSLYDPYSNLVIGDTGSNGITIKSGSSNVGSLVFADGTSGDERYRGKISYHHSSDTLKISTAGTLAMSIDSNHNVLIGTTNTNMATATGSQSGTQITDGGIAIAANNPVAQFNRVTDDGAIVNFRKNGAVVGSIGTNSGKLFISSDYGSDSGIRLGSTIIEPSTNTGAIRDGGIKLGTSTNRFQDLWLSGISYSAKNRIGTTSVINSSGEVLSVKSLSSGHSSFENNDAGNGTLYIENKETTANSYQPAIIIKSGGGNRGNIGVEYSTSTLGIAGHAGISLRTGATSLNAATERLFISSTGNVGIGTSSPRYNLAVNGSNSTAVGFAMDNTSGGGTLDLAVLGSGYNSHQAGPGEIWLFSPDNINIGGATGNTNNIKFLANNSVNMFIQGSNGNVGIGTSSPGHLLDILKSGSGDATVNIKSTTGGDPTLIFNSAAANRQGIIKFQDNGTNVGRIDYVHSADRIDIQAGSATGATMSIKNGAVGIGTSVVYEHQQGAAIDMSYDGTIWAGNTWWAGGLNTGVTFYKTTSGEKYKHSSRQAVMHYQNSQGGSHHFYSATGGTAGNVISWQELAEFDRDEVVFNNGSVDQDFRVESNDSSHMLFVDAFNNHVGVDWATPNVPLDVNGVISSRPNGGGGAYSHGLLEITSSAANPQVKITTNILWAGGTTHAHTVKISGFRYGHAQTCEVVICWHRYNNSFYSRTASSSGGFAPDITLAVENNKVVIHLGTVGYWPKLYVESMYNAYGGTSQAKGWSWSDAAISADSGTPNETVSYKTDLGGDNLIGTAGAVFNEGSADQDFRVESDSNTHALFVNASDNAVLIGQSAHIGPGNGNTTTGGGWETSGRFWASTSAADHGFNRNSNGVNVSIRNSGTQIGYIYNNSASVTYNTTSDQRLKENIADADDAGSKIDAIQVRKFDWKADGSHQDYGMVAQELLQVEPRAVAQPEDSEEMMGVDYSVLVPMLIKEIQQLRQRVAQLEEK